MKKERKVIEPYATIVFDGNVNVSELLLPPDFEGDIIINGMLYFDKPVIVKCDNLYAKSVVSDGAKVTIIGNVFTVGDIAVYDITVNGSIYCQSDIYATNIVVTEDCIVSEKFDGDEFLIGSIEVYGEFRAKAVKNISDIKVKGIFNAKIVFEFVEIEISVGIGS